ncbi:Hypothetical predicted protein [Marmota monax]|uniref:Uncharacterized protein n=1 Tax=Marmota monax TaxID=9995 RepID=A0A5E4CXY5_MARMO|nr:Hypothetical predicted protein [Marmota monax]
MGTEYQGPVAHPRGGATYYLSRKESGGKASNQRGLPGLDLGPSLRHHLGDFRVISFCRATGWEALGGPQLHQELAGDPGALLGGEGRALSHLGSWHRGQAVPPGSLGTTPSLGLASSQLGIRDLRAPTKTAPFSGCR